MKNKHFILYIIFLLLSLTACKKEKEQAPQVKEMMTALVNGKSFSADNFLVARAAGTTSINGTLGPTSNAESIGLSIGGAKVGTFTFEEGGENFAVYKSTTGEYISMSGTLEIISNTEDWIEGNFNFVAHSLNSPAQHIEVTNGKFKMKFD
jgi:hypothetical protein